ncbi:hypothetical protein J8L88_20655 [Aquimarina sp. MMG015]|uniref:hypothetical protein n=1 Tax=Aquimarina TaxID=290174 RepID=UPI0003F7B9B7|nr:MULTISPECIES: hypothetical protein [Aquimarina]AXT55844.1 hypothetical protein D1815_08805 [Aquimarina sp. AD1]MBQ4805284.1 hypothetical protein [Aquimarina sp. MMG015]RKN29730.1 hypothetical protein D7035_06770 [Aquimarina sp. AD1]
MKSPILLVTLLVFTLFSCSSSDDGTTEPEVPIDPDPIPGQTSTYVGHVKAIIDSNCTECHGTPLQNSAPMALETFQEVVNAVNDRNLFSFITTNNAFNVMPPSDNGGRMPQATIDIVEDWIADGLLEQ